ncbi:MAG: protein disulfide oxidoreductase [Chromatiales bacterium]|nr:protein disulfide oxidoreductase [Chromatiales bacterium]
MVTASEKNRPSWHRRLVNGGAQLSLLLVFVLGIEAFLTRDSLGMEAPPINATSLSGEAFSLAHYRGEPVAIHFWASWCPVCELEQGMIDGLAKDLPLMTIAMQSGPADEVSAYLATQGVTYPVINDDSGWLAKQYGVKAVPATFILDGTGRVRFATRGYTTGWGLRIRLWLAGFF